MATDLTLSLPNQPGDIATVGEALGRAGVNIEGVCGFPCGDVWLMHVLVEDEDAARQTLTSAGVEINMARPVMVTDIEDKPGELGAITRRLADNGVNADVVYLATNTRLVLGVKNLAQAERALA